MNTINFTVNNTTYQLKLNTKSICDLEKKLGYNPVDILISAQEKTPKTGDMVAILHAGLQAYNHGIKLDDVYDIFDDYISDGHDYMDFIMIIIDLFKVSGIIADEEDESPNA